MSRAQVLAHPRLELGRPRPGRQPPGAKGLGDRGNLVLVDGRRLEAEEGRTTGCLHARKGNAPYRRAPARDIVAPVNLKGPG